MVEGEVISNNKVLKKDYAAAVATKPGLQKKAPSKRVSMSKARKSTITQETMEFTLEPRKEGEVSYGKKKGKDRIKNTIARVIG